MRENGSLTFRRTRRMGSNRSIPLKRQVFTGRVAAERMGRLRRKKRRLMNNHTMTNRVRGERKHYRLREDQVFIPGKVPRTGWLSTINSSVTRMKDARNATGPTFFLLHVPSVEKLPSQRRNARMSRRLCERAINQFIINDRVNYACRP